MQTKIDDLIVTSEMVAFLKQMCPTDNTGETMLLGYVSKLIEIQDYLCRNMSQLPDTDANELAGFFETIVFIKDDLKELNSLLPVINNQ